MSDALAAAVRADPALAAVLAFSRRFGRETTALAMHAALPLGLSPELVHLLRMNFVREAPFIAEADLLLSPLCTEVGGGMYEMDADVRELLLAEMGRTAAYGPAHLRRVAQFLRAWAARGLDETADPDAMDHLRVQQWVALAYDEPARAAEALAGALRAGVDAADRPEVARVARLTTVLSAPLAAQVELRRYAGAVERLAATGSATSGTGPVTIGRQRLPSLDRVVRLWHPQAATSTPDIQQQATVAEEPPIQQQANAADKPSIQQQADDSEPGSIPSDGQYRVARVLVIGPVHTSLLMERMGATHLASAQRDSPGAWVWDAGIGDQIHGGHEVIFHQLQPDGGAFAMSVEESAAIVVLLGDSQDAASIEPWVAAARTGGPSRPVLVVVRTTDERAPDLGPIEALAKQYGAHDPIVSSARTRGEIPEVSDRIHQIIPWSRVPAAYSGAEVHWLLGEMEERFGHSVVVEYSEELRGELMRSLPLSYHDQEAELTRAMQCLTAQGFLHVIGKPPRAVVRGEAYERCRNEIWRAAGAAQHDIPGLPSVPVRWLQEHVSAREVHQLVDASLLDLVLEDLTLRGWAHRVDTGRGEMLVIPKIFNLSSKPTSPPDASFDAVIRATWPGTPDELFVLLLVHLADLGPVDIGMPNLAYVVTPGGMLRLNSSVAEGWVQLKLAATPDSNGLEAAGRLFRETLTKYLPADVTPEFVDLQFGAPAAEENQKHTHAAPQRVETKASPPYELPEPPEGVDLDEACLVILPSGTRQDRDGRVVDLDAAWEQLFKPTLTDTVLADGTSLVPVRIPGLPEPGTPLPDWMKAARLVVVDLTGTDPARVKELGLMPGFRTQSVVLIHESGFDVPSDFAGQPVYRYVFTATGELHVQRSVLSSIIVDTLRLSDDQKGAVDGGIVHMAVVAPRHTAPGQGIDIRVYVYDERARPDAEEQMRESGAEPGDIRWGPALGAVRLDTTMEMRISAPWQTAPRWAQLKWRGGVLRTSDWLPIPEQMELHPVSIMVEVLGNRVVLGNVPVTLRIDAPTTRSADAPTQQNRAARTAYACYAAADRLKAVERIGSIRAAGELEVFDEYRTVQFDDKDGPAGTRMREAICSRDVFLLFWSPEADGSGWVGWELARALECHAATGKPEIEIHLLEDTPLERIPAHLRSFSIIGPPTGGSAWRAAVPPGDPRESGPFDVLLSYSAADREQVIRIAEELYRLGLTPWLDVWTLRPGDTLALIPSEQIERIPCAVVFLGRSVDASQQADIQRLMPLFRAGSGRLLPVRLARRSGIDQIPPGLSQIQALDYSADPNAIHELVERIGSLQRNNPPP
jgi:hypothetical protein